MAGDRTTAPNSCAAHNFELCYTQHHIISLNSETQYSLSLNLTAALPQEA